MVMLVLFGSCQKNPSSTETIEEGVSQIKGGTGQVLKEGSASRYSIKYKSDTIPRVSKLPSTSIDKINSILGQKKNRTKAKVSMTGTFTATLTGGSTTDYYCEAAVDFEGPIDWYLIEESTSTYTYIGTTASESIFFFISNPTPGYYRVWGQSATMGIDTNPVYLGNPYPGVTLNNGILEFTNQTAYENILIQLENAVEQHNADFFDSRDYMTDDEINDLADLIGFDEFKPLRDFESFFLFTSLRQQSEAAIIAYDDNTTGTDPEDTFVIFDEVEQTLLNQSGQIKIAGELVTVAVSQPAANETNNCVEGYGCTPNYVTIRKQTIGDKMAKKILRVRERTTSNIYNVGLKGHAKAKVIFKKIVSSTKQKRYATKISARVYGNRYEMFNLTYCNDYPEESFDTGHNAQLRRYRRKNKKDWPVSIKARFKFCDLTGEWNIPGHGFGLISLGLQ